MHKKRLNYDNINNAISIIFIIIFTITIILSFSSGEKYLSLEPYPQDASLSNYFLSVLTGMAYDIATLNFTILSVVQNISVEAPLNGSIIYDSDIYFNYTVYGNANETITCNLTLDGEVNKTITDIQEGVLETTLVTNLDYDFHIWNLSCWYNPILKYISGTYNFTNLHDSIDYDVWDSIVYPEGIYEPYNPGSAGARLSTFKIKFVNVSADTEDDFSCLIEQSNGNIIEVKDSPSGAIEENNFTINYTITSGVNITKDTPWKIHNCSFYRSSSLIYSDNGTYNLEYHNNSYNPRPILIREDNYWTKFNTVSDDAYLASSCFLGVSGVYFDNTLKCDYVGDVAFASSMADGFNMERVCNDGIDNDGNGFIDCEDRYCQGIPYPCKPHEYLGNHYNTCENGVCTVTRTIGSESITYSYNKYIQPNGSLKVRFDGGNYGTINPIRYSITDLKNDNYGIKSGRYNNTYENTHYLENFNFTQTSVWAESPNGYNGEVDLVIWVNLSSDLYPEGEYNFSLHLIHYGSDLLITGIPIHVNSSAPSVWKESDVGTGRTAPCTTDIDEDFDYLISCADSDCWGHVGGVNYYNGSDAYCSEFEICDDGFDNNRDSLIDCEDNYCDLNISKPFPQFYHPSNNSIPVRCHVDGEGKDDYDTTIYNWTLACTDEFNNDAEGGFSSEIFGVGGNVDCWDETYCWGRGGISTELPCPMYENNTVEWCFDGIDNDYDGLIDCLDADCLGIDFVVTQDFLDTYNEQYYIDNFNRTPVLDEYLVCSNIEPINVFNETEPARCFDSIDNDFDTFIDCADPDCWGITYGGITCLQSEFNLTAWLENNRFDTLVVNVSYCSDSIDNDGDSYIDCDDTNCKQKFGYCGPCPSYENYTWASCADGIDNNNDGLIDCLSSDCYGKIGSFDSSQICSSTEICDDRFDNTGDGNTDCQSSSCWGEYGADGQICAQYENTDSLCSDGYDNTGNGLIDCMKSSCWNTNICSERYWNVVSNTAVPYYTGWIDVGSTSIQYRNLRRHYVDTNYILGVRGTTSPYESVTITIGNAVDSDKYFPYNATSCVLSGDTDKINWVATQEEVGQLQNAISPINEEFEVMLNCSSKDSPGINNNYPISVTNELSGSTEQDDADVPTTVYENDAPNITAIEFAPNFSGEVNLVKGSSLSIRGIPTDDVSGISRCTFNLTSDSYDSGIVYSNGNCIYSFNNIVDSGTYTLEISARDGVSNVGDVSLYNLVVDILPVNNDIGINFIGNAYPFYNSSKNDIVEFESSFSSCESKTIDSCLAYIEDEFGNVVDSKSVNVTPDVNVICNSDFDISSLDEGKYYVVVNATDSVGNVVVSNKKVFFNCPTYGNNYEYCVMADFDKDGFRDIGDPVIGSCDYTDVPVIELISPDQDYSTSPLEITFEYIVYHSNDIANCSLIIDDIMVQNSSNVTLSEQNNFSQFMNVGEYEWKINCVDINNTASDSETRDLTVSIPPASPPSGGGPSCTYNWVCGDWTPEVCPPSGIQTRECENLGTCTGIVGMPETERECVYEPVPIEEEIDVDDVIEDVIKEIIDDKIVVLELDQVYADKKAIISSSINDTDIEFVIDYSGLKPKFNLNIDKGIIGPADYDEWPDWIKVLIYLALIAIASFASLHYFINLRNKYFVASKLYRTIIKQRYLKQINDLLPYLGTPNNNKYVYVMAMWKYQKFMKRVTRVDGRKTNEVLNKLDELGLDNSSVVNIYKRYILRSDTGKEYTYNETLAFVNEIKDSIDQL